MQHISCVQQHMNTPGLRARGPPICLMKPFISLIIISLALIVLAILGAILCLLLCLTLQSILSKSENVQKYWIKIDKEIREPQRFRFILWLIYGIGFDCLTRSLLYSVLQIIGVIKLHIPLGFVGEYVVTCICSFGGSFLATAFYKSEGSSHAVPYSAALAVLILPSGLVKLIIESEKPSAGDWTLWSVSIVALSLIASLLVFKFVTFPINELDKYQLEEFDSFPKPSSVDNVEGDEQPNPSLQDHTENTVEEDIQESDEDQEPTKPKDVKDPDARPLISIACPIFLGVLLLSRTIEVRVYSYHGSGEYLNILILNLTQLVILFFCGLFCLSMHLLGNTSPKIRGWSGWSVLIINIPFFIGCFYKDSRVIEDVKNADSKLETGFQWVDFLRLLFKLAAAELLFIYTYYIVCLRKAKSVLRSAEPHELDAFEGEQTQTV